MPHVQRACPVCTCAQVDVVFNNAMAAVGGFDMSYTIGRCQQCGFHFAHVLADDATFQNYYRSVSKYDVAGHISALDQVRIEAAAQFCDAHVPKHHMVVDLGCGFGAMLSQFKIAGWTNLHGVDPAPNSAERAHTLFGLANIHCATMEQAHTVVSLGDADLVCVMAVLEHLPNLRADMTALLARLRPGCKILVEVPAVEYFSNLHNEPFGEFSLEHIQFFTATSLKNLFRSLGASPIAIHMQDLPMIHSGSVFGLFQLAPELGSGEPLEPERDTTLEAYVAASRATLDLALQGIPAQPLIIYGAGSHTARLIPLLEQMPGISIAAVVDSNPNLQGKPIGTQASTWTIEAPGWIEQRPELPVLVSSFRSQREIASSLQGRYPNPLVLLYP